MSVTNLMGTTWTFSNNLPYELYNAQLSATYDIDFYSYLNASDKSHLFTTINIIYDGNTHFGDMSYTDGLDAVYAIANVSWNAPLCKVIEIVGGDDIKDAGLISFLETYATQTGVAPVLIEYNDDTIAILRADGTKQLNTDGKYCIDDISVTYTESSSGGGAETNNICIDSGTAYWTDGTFTVQHADNPQNVSAVVGSLVFVKVISMPPEPGVTTSGVTQILSTSAYKLYSVNA